MTGMPTTGPRLQVFGPEHLVVLGVFALGCIAAVLLGRGLSTGGARRFERAAGAVVLVVCTPFEVVDWMHGVADWRVGLPLQICDVAWLVAGIALLSRRPRWSALLYFWGLTLSLQGVITPDLDTVFPHLQFFGFWVRHLTPVWAALYLVGARRGPTWAGYRFAVLVTAAWAVAMMVLNALLGSNYGYLNGKPASHSLLDVLGPWPWYVVVEVALVILVWALMTWPWNRPSTRPAASTSPPLTGHK